MRFIKYSVLAAACLAPLSFAFGQSPGLEQRVDSLEHKLDAIMELLQQQKGVAAPVATGQEPTSSSTPVGFVPGVYLDVYSAGIELKYGKNNDDFRLPESYPSASIALQPTSSFSYGDFLLHGETQNVSRSSSSLLGVKYSGYLLIKAGGRHGIGIAMDLPRYYSCIMQFYMNGKRIISHYFYTDSHPSDQQDITLNPGLYKIEAFFACENPDMGGATAIDFKGIKMSMKMAGPGDRALMPISSDRLFVKQ